MSLRLNKDENMTFNKTRVYTEIEIDAPAVSVWEVLVDTDAYSSWNPLIQCIKGRLQTGSQLEVTIQLPKSAAMNFKPTITAAEIHKELRWVGALGMKGVFDGEHFFIVDEIPGGRTVFRHGENFSGVLAWPLFLLIGSKTKDGFHAMNAALKHRVEAMQNRKLLASGS